ncbi:response regulator transcription factor [Dyella sp. A6]|uniref:response regulator transcription factor n=1 Tax=Dyella aluminiiresistens TaxID=3069105 RepID=UPI002E78414E|nr:response regulator transcription factor [Dyella sp. A6]
MSSGRASGTGSHALQIAVLEDDVELRDAVLLPALRDYGFAVTGAGLAAELYRHMISHQFDIVVLDMGLPDEDGLSVARYLRSASTHIGLIMLTGSREKNDRIRALQESVDAFLSKPVDVDVLAATLHSLARRLQAPAPSSAGRAMSHAGWHLEADGWRLIAPNDSIVALTAPEQCVLTTLMARMGEPVSRETLIEALTDDIYDFDPHRLEMMIHRLRRKAREQTGEPLPLLTARGTGYLFAAGESIA